MTARANQSPQLLIKGKSVSDGRVPSQRKRTVKPRPAAPSLTCYTCPELGRTCQRSGAYDAFSLPSMFGRERRMPKGVL